MRKAIIWGGLFLVLAAGSAFGTAFSDTPIHPRSPAMQQSATAMRAAQTALIVDMTSHPDVYATKRTIFAITATADTNATATQQYRDLHYCDQFPDERGGYPSRCEPPDPAY